MSNILLLEVFECQYNLSCEKLHMTLRQPVSLIGVFKELSQCPIRNELLHNIQVLGITKGVEYLWQESA